MIMFVEFVVAIMILTILAGLIIEVMSVFRPTKRKTALIIVDPQYDFCEGGSLAVGDAIAIFPEINTLRKKMQFDKVFITQDWHPTGHVSFASTHDKEPFTKVLNTINHANKAVVYEQDLWPTHCVAYSKGSEFHHELQTKPSDEIIRKGTLKGVDSYSGFGDSFDNKFEKTNLDHLLKWNEITDVVVCGLATDFCVQATALDALKYGYKVNVIKSTVRGAMKPSTDEAFERMTNRGVQLFETVTEFINYVTQVADFC